MRQVSRMAARPSRKGGVPNALFLLAAAETLPGPLRASADLVTVTLPWGSLLRGLVGADPALATPITALLRPAGRLELLISIGPRDIAEGLRPLDQAAIARLVDAYRALGLWVEDARPATAADVEASGSSWARRLGIPRSRDGWLLRFTAGAGWEPAPAVRTSDGQSAAASSGGRSTTPGETPDAASTCLAGPRAPGGAPRDRGRLHTRGRPSDRISNGGHADGSSRQPRTG